MSSASPYSAEYYDQIMDRSLSSARVILGSLWHYWTPQSVVDVGCGAGAWLKAAAELGAAKIQGLEGSWVKRETTVIPFDQIKTTDLAQPFALPDTFDLAISMEVAEHLPPSRGPGFVKDITRLAKIVLFSAAVPSQPGVNHVNGQWPEYWSQLFAQEGYLTFDFIRTSLWTNPEVSWWYSQNALVYIEGSFFREMASFRDLVPHQVVKPLPLIHPELLAMFSRPTLSRILFELLPVSIHRSLAHRLGTKSRGL